MITVSLDDATVRDVERRLGSLQSQAPRALKNAINETARQARRDLANEAKNTYTLKQGGFNKSMKLKGATMSRPEATITTRGEQLSIKKSFSTYAGTKQGGAPLSVLINKKHGRKQFSDSAFVNNIARKGQTRKKDTKKGKAGSAVKHMAAAYREDRTGKKRLPIHELYSVSIPQMIGNEKDVYGIVAPKMQDNLMAAVDKQVEKILKG